jgi:hypothetical protein
MIKLLQNINIFRNNTILLGRWMIPKNIKEVEKKIDWNNYDHCFCQPDKSSIDVFPKSKRVSRIKGV